MSIAEINFDGIVGPSHNYAGLSLGNLASARNAGAISRPRDAALEGVAKMRAALVLGLRQGILLPHRRPDRAWLGALGERPETADPVLLANALSASPMWAANAATVSPGPDTADGRCHLTVANLMTMPHRAHEWPETLAQLRLAFADGRHFAVHPPAPPPFGDEGAANHMRLASGHAAAGVELFVYGAGGGPFPARQHELASRAVARLHGLDPARTLFLRQSDAAIAAGAFHNDVVAVANGPVLFCHEESFAGRDAALSAIRGAFPTLALVEAPADRVALSDCIASYVFNSQLVTLDDGQMALIAPAEVRDVPSVSAWLDQVVASGGPIRRVETVDVRQSMANGGGPACLRLRVACDPATVDPRFLVDDGRLDRIARVIDLHWPESIAPADLSDPALWRACEAARAALFAALDLSELI